MSLMNQDDKDLLVPDFGPADEPVVDSPKKVAQSQSQEKKSGTEQPAPVVVKDSGGGFINSFVLILLTVACGGLGYFGFEAYQTLVDQKQVIAAANTRIAGLEQQLTTSNTNAQASGQTLAEKIAQLESQSAEKFSLYDSEVAKLWDLANKANKSEISAAKTDIASAKTAIESTNNDVKTITGNLTAVEKRAAAAETLAKEQASLIESQTAKISALTKQITQLEKAQAAQNKKQSSLQSSASKTGQTLTANKNALAELTKTLSTLETQIVILEETYTDQQAALQSQIKQQNAQLAKLEKAQKRPVVNSQLSSRVTANEQDIQAINGARRQFVNDIRRLKDQVNQIKVILN